MTQPVISTGGGANNVGGGTSYGGMFGPTVTGPNPDAYNNLLAQANASAEQYGAQGQGFTQQGAQIVDPDQAASQAAIGGSGAQLGNIGALLQQTAGGQGPAVTAAQAQMTQATDQNLAAQAAAARSATGGALAQNGAMLAGQGQMGATLGQAAGASAAGLAQQELAAGQAAGQVYGAQGQLALGQYGQELGTAQAQAQLAQANQATQNQMRLGLGGLAEGAQGQGLSALNGYNSANTAAENTAAGVDQNNFNDVMGLAKTAASTIGGGLMSDARVKDDIEDEGDTGRTSLADDFLSQLHPASFRYHDAQDEPSPSGGGRYLGVMAQDLVRTRDVGPQLVGNTSRGMAVEPKATLSAALAGLGRLHERVQALEGGRR